VRPASRTASPLLVAALAAALLAGCGSSSSSTGTTQATGTTATTASTGTTNASGSSLKVIGRPRFPVPSKSEPVRTGQVEIAYRNITARPTTLRVKRGTVVVFANYDPVEHNAKSVGGPQHFSSSNFKQGQSFSVLMTKVGITHFECTIHPATINGSIEVVG
jgi:plastocyanin